MKSIFLLIVFVSVLKLTWSGSPHDADIEDNDFAEFEEFDDEDDEFLVEDEEIEAAAKRLEDKEEDPGIDDMEEDDDTSVETEDDEFEHFTDEEEFEGFDKERGPVNTKSQDKLPELKMAKVPIHLRTNWDSFYMEMLMLAGLGVYFLNFLAGKTKNTKLAQAWLNSHKDLLDSHFHIVGDDGTSKEAQSGPLMKESENVYALWCSGRKCVEGMLVELKLLKRQDLINSISRILKPASDKIMIRVDMEATSMDKFVLAVVQKRSYSKLHKEMNDLSQFAEKKTTERFNDLPTSYVLVSEVGEATAAILDKKVCQALARYEGMVEYIHMSDQYSGVKPQDDSQAAKMPEAKPTLMFAFNVPGKGKPKTSDMDDMKPLLQLVFYCIDKVSRLQLGKEARLKAEKNRQKAQEAFLKSAHLQRQEAAQQRREEKRKAEKERIMNEDDPEKTRKWEDRENRREAKKKQPKMKMMKIKGM